MRFKVIVKLVNFIKKLGLAKFRKSFSALLHFGWVSGKAISNGIVKLNFGFISALIETVKGSLQRCITDDHDISRHVLYFNEFTAFRDFSSILFHFFGTISLRRKQKIYLLDSLQKKLHRCSRGK